MPRRGTLCISEAKETMDLSFWLGATGLAIIGLVFLFLYYGVKMTKGNQVIKWIAIVAFVFAFASYTGIYALSTQSTGQAVSNQVNYAVTVSKTAAFVSVNAATQTISWEISYNTTTHAFVSSSGSATLTIATSWAGGALVSSAPELSCGAAPVVTSANSPGTVVQQSAGVPQELFTKSDNAGSAYGSIYVYVPYGNTTTTTLAITLDGSTGGACNEMSNGQIYPMQLNLAGQTWTLNFIAYSIKA